MGKILRAHLYSLDRTYGGSVSDIRQSLRHGKYTIDGIIRGGGVLGLHMINKTTSELINGSEMFYQSLTLGPLV